MGKVEIFPGMDNPQEAELQKTLFQGDEERNFRISSTLEIASILRAIAMQGTHACIHYGGGSHAAITTAIGLDEHGLWLDASWFPQEDLPLLLAGGLTFVSMQQQVKIQFDADSLAPGTFMGRRAFHLAWPAQLLRIQRREFFRSPVPASNSASCLIPLQAGLNSGRAPARTAHLADIGGGGIRLLCEEHDTELRPERTFPGCQLSLPDAEPLTVTLEVRNNGYFTAPDQSTYKRVGCRFVNLGNQANILLQRHITRLQGETMNRRHTRI